MEDEGTEKVLEGEVVTPEEMADKKQEEKKLNELKTKLCSNMDKLLALLLNKTACKKTDKIKHGELEETGFSESLIDVIEYYLPDNSVTTSPVTALLLAGLGIGIIVLEKEPLKTKESKPAGKSKKEPQGKLIEKKKTE